jgi:hypothetical protein
MRCEARSGPWWNNNASRYYFSQNRRDSLFLAIKMPCLLK